MKRAYMYCYVEFVRKFANPVLSLLQNKCTPLHIAAREGDEELVKTLLDHKANVNILSKVSPSCKIVKVRNGVINIII
jgi:uncharacterized protein YbbK (DUF523 family)